MDLDLTGKVALVLGSTAGLGRASAEALAAEGAHVVVAGRRAELVDALVESLPSAAGVVADVTDPDTPALLVNRARESFGEVDIVVLNGGGPPPGPADAFTAETAQAAFDLLLKQHISLVGQVLPGMRERRWGRIVAIGSSGVQQPIPTLTASNVGRAALAAYLKTLAGTVAADGVTVNMALPGRIDTDRVAQLDRAAAERTGTTPDASRASSEAAIPARRYGDPAEFGAVVAFLASQQAAYVTGEQVRVDGGLVGAY
ncbi:SDR family oxidoreductase [Nocardioides sp. zg-1228]|uniref:SDR family oxidoreductase n=1 Tax=Nocardioides sp. zg-1228 TaxID=2763008 RepID=UPI0016436518|nr:SDR family oxidoreductase [Nocardioides sp. zg-1228]MBC2931969.1 SDR family oxidoreductase [Nocardioides sp. zg-1228]QSF57525.1 SDR family oxidoreductase [Nocardioides sp. zg-1228]